MAALEEVFAVIGANYGDEGKGRTTHLLSDSDTVVVKHNGGAQAGHTVETNGSRVVFNQLGSGAPKGAATVLDHTFCVNPVLLQKEIEAFEKTFGFTPKVYVHKHAKIVSNLDMIANQLIETARGANRHGSCGHGINECVTRYAQIGSGADSNNIKAYYKKRLALIGVVSKEEIEKFMDAPVWPTDLSFLSTDSIIEGLKIDMSAVGDPKRVIYESGQGLGLDEVTGIMPHVTRSRTGGHNVYKAGLFGLSPKVKCEWFYVTRAYVTRHGKGPLAHEHLSDLERSTYIPRFKDETNVHNEWQGGFRTGHLDHSVFKRIDHDIITSLPIGPSGNARSNLIVTCCDQLDAIQFVNNKHTRDVYTPDLAGVTKLVEDADCTHFFKTISIGRSPESTHSEVGVIKSDRKAA